MNILSILDESACRPKIKAKNKEDVLRKIAGVASETSGAAGVSKEEIFRKLMEREEQGTTGFGNGVAIPHARLEGMSEFLVFAVTTARPVDFEALDKKKVSVFFVVLGPAEAANEHLRLLAAISHLVSNVKVRKELEYAGTGTALYEAIVRSSTMAEDQGAEERKMVALFLVLYIDEMLYDILEFFIEEGIEGATVIESVGMGQYVSNIPLFASFIGFLNEDKNRSRTIMALVPEERMSQVIRGIEDITGDLEKKEGAMVFTLNVPFHKGTMRMM